MTTSEKMYYMTLSQKKMEAIIPYQQGNFITFPLMEEGDYRPTINIWQIYKTKEEIPNLEELKDEDVDIDITEIVEIHKVNIENAIRSLAEDVSNEEYFLEEIDCYRVNFSISTAGNVLDHPDYVLNELLDKATEIIDWKELENFRTT